MTEAFLPPIPDPVITAPPTSRIATDPEGRSRRRANGRGLNAFVIVKPGAEPTSDEAPGAGARDLTAVQAGDAGESATREATSREKPSREGGGRETPGQAPTEALLSEITELRPGVAAAPAPAVMFAPATPAVDPLLIGQAVAEAVASAVSAQTDLADRYLFAARRIDELEAELRALALDREATAEAFDARIRAMEAEREEVMVELVARLHHLEAERDHLAEELRGERDRRLVEAAELLADVLTPRLCGVLDEHTGLADRYAAAAQRVGELENQVARLTDQVNGAHAWRTEFEELERAAVVRPWWKFWG